jgi:hypothetical protein
MEETMKAKRFARREPERSYNVQGWVSPIDVAKLIEVLEVMTKIRVVSISDIVRNGLVIAARATTKYQEITKDISTIEEALDYIENKGFTMNQRYDSRKHLVGNALSTEDIEIDGFDKDLVLGMRTMKHASNYRGAIRIKMVAGINQTDYMERFNENERRMMEEKISGVGKPTVDNYIDKASLAGPIVTANTDKYPLEPEEHKGTCRHRGLVLDDGINCNKCGFFAPNEVAPNEVEDNEKEKEI